MLVNSKPTVYFKGRNSFSPKPNAQSFQFAG